MEEWKIIDGYGGKYSISNYGRVVSTHFKKNIIIKPDIARGYKRVLLQNNPIKKHLRVHRLVAFYFCEGYKEGLEVNHKDFNKFNNVYSNLEWVTSSQNKIHSSKNGRSKYQLGESNCKAKLNESDIKQIRYDYANSNITHKKLSDKYNVTPTNICLIINRQTWSHI